MWVTFNTLPFHSPQATYWELTCQCLDTIKSRFELRTQLNSKDWWRPKCGWCLLLLKKKTHPVVTVCYEFGWPFKSALSKFRNKPSNSNIIRNNSYIFSCVPSLKSACASEQLGWSPPHPGLEASDLNKPVSLCVWKNKDIHLFKIGQLRVCCSSELVVYNFF